MTLTTTKHDNSLKALLISVFILLFAFALLSSGIAAIHMQPDETLTYVTTNRSFYGAVEFTLFHDVHAPLWFILAWVWQQFTGLGEFAGRYQSILYSMLSLAIAYQIGRSGFKRREFGWFAMALLATNAFFYVYSLEIRPYPLVMLAAALSYRFFLAWLEKRTWHHALFYGLSLSLLLYTHYYLAFVLLSQVIYFLIFKLLDWRLLLKGVIAGLLGAVLLIPQIIVLLYQLRFVNFTQGSNQGVPTSPTNFDSIFELAQFASNGWIILFLLIIVLGIVRLWKYPSYRISLVWFVLAPSLLILANLRTPLLTTRYISFAAPAISLVAGFSLAAWLPNRLHWRTYAVWASLILLIGINLYHLPNFLPLRIPFREIFAEVNINYEEGDVLLLNHQRFENFLEDQYSRYLSNELMANQVETIEEAQAARRIWFISESIFDDSYQNIFSELESSHRVAHVIGDCTRAWCYIAQLMIAPPMREAVYFGDSIGFYGADISAIANHHLPVLLWWGVETSPEADYSISLQLIAEDGRLVSQVDRQIDPPEAEIGEIATSALVPNASYLDLRVLELPDNLAEGSYRLELVVYQWWDGQRLTLADGSDSYLIKTIEILGDE